MKYILKIYLTKYILDKNKKGRLVFLLNFFFFGIEFAIKVNNDNDKELQCHMIFNPLTPESN